MAESPFRGMPREVPALVAVAFAVAVGFGIVAPALPLFARRFGVSHTEAAAVVSVFALARLASAPGAGRVVDRVGERLSVATGIVVVAVSSLLAGLARSYPQLLVLRGAGGLGSALFSVGATSLLLRSVRSDQRARASGLLSGGFLLGGIAGPTVGGVVIAAWSIRAPFFLYAGTLAAAGTVALTMLRRPAPGSAAARPAGGTRLRVALRNRAYRAALAANLADAWAMLGVRSALLPLFVAEVLHRSPVWTGAGFAIALAGNGLVLLPAGRFADRFGRRPVLVAGCIISAAGMAVLAAAPTLAGFLGAMVVLGLGSGLLDVAPAAVVGDVAAGRSGQVVAAYQMSGDAGAVAGPVVSGRLADAVSYPAAFGLTSGVLVVAAALSALAPETVAHEPAVALPAEASTAPR